MGEDDRQKLSQAERLIRLITPVCLFHNQHKEAFAFLAGEALPLRNKRFKQWLAYQLYNVEKRSPNSDTLNQAITTLEGKALYERPQITLHNRIAKLEDSFFYDMGDNRAIKIIAKEWLSVGSRPR